jgi:hypothetical protein
MADEIYRITWRCPETGLKALDWKICTSLKEGIDLLEKMHLEGFIGLQLDILTLGHDGRSLEARHFMGVH